MKKVYLLFSLCLLVVAAKAQYQSLDTIKAPAKYENIYVRALYVDSADVSSYVIFVRNEVKAHKHETHAEHVFVLEGIGMMTLGDKKFKIKKGDVIFMPKNTFHSFLSISKKDPLNIQIAE